MSSTRRWTGTACFLREAGKDQHHACAVLHPAQAAMPQLPLSRFTTSCFCRRSLRGKFALTLPKNKTKERLSFTLKLGKQRQSLKVCTSISGSEISKGLLSWAVSAQKAPGLSWGRGEAASAQVRALLPQPCPALRLPAAHP